jgi:uncharacterized protein (DUF433 family)
MATDIREIPTYGLTEASHYLRVPLGSLRFWVYGQRYSTAGGEQRSQPIVRRPDPRKPLLSFLNLAEIHVLDSMRREHEISLQKVRRALGYLCKEFPSKRPLIQHAFETDGVDLFVEKYGELLNITRQGQVAMKEVMRAYLHRIEYDEKGLAARPFPFTRKRALDEPQIIVIDPALSFGRPVIAGTGIATAAVAERYKAGESIGELADDYGRTAAQIEDAIRCELDVRAA